MPITPARTEVRKNDTNHDHHTYLLPAVWRSHRVCHRHSRHGRTFAIYWGYEDRETDYDLRASQKLFRRDLANAFINGALDRGLYFHSYWNANIPSHCGFSVQHTLADADITLEKMDAVMADMKKLL